MNDKKKTLKRFICKNCKQTCLVTGGSSYFICNNCKPKNHYTFSKQYKAQVAVSKAKKIGLLEPATNFACVDCGQQAIEYDHRNYDEPLKVDPVCRGCNLRRGPAFGWVPGQFSKQIHRNYFSL